MAAPTALRTQLAALLDAAWDLFTAGQFFNRAWGHETVTLTVGGRTVTISVSGEGDDGYTRFIFIVKRVP